MIVICESCGKKYLVEPKMIKDKAVSFDCYACQHRIIFENPRDEESQSDIFPQPLPIHSPPEINSPSDLNLPSAVDDLTVSPSMQTESVESRKMQQHRFPLINSMVCKIILLTMCISLIPLLGMSLFALHLNHERVQSSLDKIGNEMTISLLNPVDEWLDKNFEALELASRTPEMQSLDQKLQEQVLRPVHDKFPWINATFTGNICGENIARSDYGELSDYSDQPYYHDVMKGKTRAIHTYIDLPTNRLMMILAVPIKRGNEIVGFAAANMNTDKFTTPVSDWKHSKSGFAFLVDENNKALVHPRKNYVLKEMKLTNNPLIAAVQDHPLREIQSFVENNEEMLGYVKTSKNSWKIAIQQPQKEAFASHGKTIVIVYLTFLVTAAIVFLFSWLHGRAIVKPIILLTQTAGQIATGSIPKPLVITARKDEIGSLARAIGKIGSKS